MPEKITKKQILAAIVSDYFDDYEFINKINDITYHQKVKLFNAKKG